LAVARFGTVLAKFGCDRQDDGWPEAAKANHEEAIMKLQALSIAEGLRRAHGRLLADLRELEKAVHLPSEVGVAPLTDRLTAMRAAVIEHFRIEEQDGYLNAVRKREPRLERAIQQLAEEHGQLARSLAAVIAEARGATDVSDKLREKVRDWIECVRRHEARENDVVQDAFNQDISAED
jgi:hemerythrin-like domain-containing protein